MEIRIIITAVPQIDATAKMPQGITEQDNEKEGGYPFFKPYR